MLPDRDVCDSGPVTPLPGRLPQMPLLGCASIFHWTSFVLTYVLHLPQHEPEERWAATIWCDWGGPRKHCSSVVPCGVPNSILISSYQCCQRDICCCSHGLLLLRAILCEKDPPPWCYWNAQKITFEFANVFLYPRRHVKIDRRSLRIISGVLTGLMSTGNHKWASANTYVFTWFCLFVLSSLQWGDSGLLFTALLWNSAVIPGSISCLRQKSQCTTALPVTAARVG